MSHKDNNADLFGWIHAWIVLKMKQLWWWTGSGKRKVLQGVKVFLKQKSADRRQMVWPTQESCLIGRLRVGLLRGESELRAAEKKGRDRSLSSIRTGLWAAGCVGEVKVWTRGWREDEEKEQWKMEDTAGETERGQERGKGGAQTQNERERRLVSVFCGTTPNHWHSHLN